MRTIGTLLAISAILTGCAANSVEDVKSHPATKYDFVAGGNYQENYKKIADSARRCLQSAFIGSSMNVEADLLPDSNRGTISIAAVQFGTQYWASAEVTPDSGGNTHVTVWNYLHTWDYIGPRMQAWTNGDPACR